MYAEELQQGRGRQQIGQLDVRPGPALGSNAANVKLGTVTTRTNARAAVPADTGIIIANISLGNLRSEDPSEDPKIIAHKRTQAGALPSIQEINIKTIGP